MNAQKLILTTLVIFVGLKPVADAQIPQLPFNPKKYVVQRTLDSLHIDGKLNEQSWQQAPSTDSFIDLAQPKPKFKTTAKMLWDDTYLYIAAEMEEPHVWGRLTQRDTVIFYDNDFEVFIDPDGDTHNYYELEINALGTVWDLLLTKPYRDGGKAIDGWDISGLQSAIDIQGTLNDPTDRDSGWTVELTLPWRILEEAAVHNGPPENGEQWRINFSRVQWYHQIKNGKYVKKMDAKTGKKLPEENWVWSPQGVINMHYPEMWGVVQFSNTSVGELPPDFKENPEEQIKWYLRQLYYRQREWRENHGAYTDEIEELKAEKLFQKMKLDEKFPSLTSAKISNTKHTFQVQIINKDDQTSWYIDETGRVWNHIKRTLQRPHKFKE